GGGRHWEPQPYQRNRSLHAGHQRRRGVRCRAPPLWSPALSRAGSFFVRWRVRTGYFVAPVVLWFAHPTPLSILCGAVVGVIGLAIRALAAGHLHKKEILAISGPDAPPTNPLYFGRPLLALGAALRNRPWVFPFVLFSDFPIF